MPTRQHAARPILPWLLHLAACASVALTAATAFAQSAQSAPKAAVQPMANPNVDALVAALRAGPPTRSFRRTELPDSGSNLCNGQAQAPGSGAANSGTNNGTNSATRGLGTGRNLEVVPYAGDTTPGVNLSVQFATGSDKLTKGDQALLDTVAAALKDAALAQDRFAVAGHTDTSGDARINLELSCARALAVRGYLAGKGVAAARLSAYGFGQTRLLAADEPTAGANRRVEIRRAPE